jgi:hypothetical protein
MSDYRCWLCGAEAGTIEVTSPTDQCRVYVAGAWPQLAVDGHEHAARPPTPGELLADGARAFDRLMRIWAE